MDDARGALSVCLVGAGRWARVAHAPAWRDAPGARLVAVVDRRVERAAALAADVGAAAYASLEEAFAHERFQVVDVASSTPSHWPLARLALEAHCHVLCEKPIAADAARAAELDALAQRVGVRGAVAYPFRHAAAIRALRARLEGGSLGRLYHVQGVEQNALYHDADEPRPPERLRAAGEVGALGEYGSHLVDLVRWLVGEFQEVAGDVRTYLPERAVEGGGRQPSEVDDSAVFVARLAGGVQGVFQTSWLAAGRPPGIEIRVYGERGGMAVWLREHPDGTEGIAATAIDDGIYRPLDARAITGIEPAAAGDWPRRYMTEVVRSFVRSLHGAPAVVASFADGAAAQRVLDAVQRSHALGAWQAVATAPAR